MRKPKHPNGIAITKTKQGFRWRAWSFGRSIGDSGKDGYRRERDMWRSMASLHRMLGEFLHGGKYELE